MFDGNHATEFRLLYAADRGETDALERILTDEPGIIDVTSFHGNTPLIRAAVQGHHETVLALLRRGAQTEIANSYGNTALIWAAMNGHAKVVDLLLHYGADPCAQNFKRETAMSLAVRHGRDDGIAALKRRAW